MLKSIPTTLDEFHNIPYVKAPISQATTALLRNDLQLLDKLRQDQHYPSLRRLYNAYHQVNHETINWLLQYHPNRTQLETNLAAKEGVLKGVPDRQGVYWAAKEGHLELLKQISNNPDRRAATAAACGGYLEIVKWIATHKAKVNHRFTGVPALPCVLPDREAITSAIKRKDWPMYQWLMQQGYVPSLKNLTHLLQEKCSKWLKCFAAHYQKSTFNDLPFPKELIKALMKEEWNQAAEIMQRPIFTSADMAAMMVAAETGDVETLEKFCQKKKVFMHQISLKAAQYGQVNVLTWMEQQGLQIDSRLLMNAGSEVRDWFAQRGIYSPRLGVENASEELNHRKRLPQTIEEARLMLPFITPKRSNKHQETYTVTELRQIIKNLGLDTLGNKATLAQLLIAHLNE